MSLAVPYACRSGRRGKIATVALWVLRAGPEPQKPSRPSAPGILPGAAGVGAAVLHPPARWPLLHRRGHNFRPGVAAQLRRGAPRGRRPVPAGRGVLPAIMDPDLVGLSPPAMARPPLVPGWAPPWDRCRPLVLPEPPGQLAICRLPGPHRQRPGPARAMAPIFPGDLPQPLP